MAKVLLVEDDNNLREIYQARLMAEGYDIVAAQNGEEALVSAKQNKPDLIISDVMMPRISGFEMLDILRNTDELKHTKVIMLTALGQAEDQARADNLGADKYLVKSQVTLEDIVNAAKELLGEEGNGPVTTATPTAASVTPAEPVTTPVVADTPVTPTPPAPAEPVSTAPVNLVAVAPEPVVPASVVPQPNTTVVVPPAPADPTPPTVTVTPLPPEPTTSADVAVAAPELPTPAPAEPVEPVTPETPAPTQEPTVVDAASETAAETSVADSSPQTLESEEAALKAQIEGFASQPAENLTEVAPSSDAVSNDQALASAVEQLNATAETLTPTAVESAPPVEDPQVNVITPTAAPAAPAPEPETDTPAAPDTLGDSATIAHKKIIQPISSNQPGPSLDELLAKDAAQTPPPPAAPIVNGAPAPAPVEPTTKPGQSFDPNSISL